jgi:propanol-preferring alcohol dehydrogenase
VKGWQLAAFGEPLRLIDIADPEPGPGEVVVDVEAAGLCHSDVAEMQDHGHDWILGRIIGHELAGVLSAVGPGVTRWHVGDRAAVCPTASSSIPGYMRDGGFATKHLAPADDLVAIPAGVGFTLGAMMTDAGMTAHHALVRRGGLRAGDKVGIIGLGGLGQIAVRVAILRGADVHVAEPKRDVWPVAQRLGVQHIAGDAAEWENQNFDLIVDYAGFGTTTAAAIRAVRPDGTVVLVGLGVRQGMINYDDMIRRRVRLLASRGGTKEDIAELYEYVASGQLRPAVTEIGFDEIPQGLRDLQANRAAGRLVARF